MKTVRVRIRGRVQGVWYRAWTIEQATAHKLLGWVRNRADGSVEALLAGTEQQVNQLLALMWEGPSAARVDSLLIERSDEQPAPVFSQKPTY